MKLSNFLLLAIALLMFASCEKEQQTYQEILMSTEWERTDVLKNGVSTGAGPAIAIFTLDTWTTITINLDGTQNELAQNYEIVGERLNVGNLGSCLEIVELNKNKFHYTTCTDTTSNWIYEPK